MSPSDSDLIACVRTERDCDAFGELVQRHQGAVRGFLRQLTHGDAARADDLAQETFLHAWRRLADFRGEARFSTWLLGIAYNRFRNARRTWREPSPDQLPDIIDESVGSPAQTTALRHDLDAALRQLSPEEQTVLHVCYRQGLSHGEAAEVLGWPLGTVKTHLARSKEKLRQLLVAWNPQS